MPLTYPEPAVIFSDTYFLAFPTAQQYFQHHILTIKNTAKTVLSVSSMVCSTAVPSLLPTHLQQFCHCDSLETTALILLTCCWQCSPLNTLTDTDANTQAHFTPTRLFNSVFTLHSTTPNQTMHLHLMFTFIYRNAHPPKCTGFVRAALRPCARSRARPR